MTRKNDIDQARGWRPHLTWPLLLLVGWALYEATAQPGLAAAITCAKFGWADVQAAFWLRRVDPDRGRGRACFWYYLAFGLWKVAVLAVILTMAVLFFSSFFDNRPRRGVAIGLSPALGGVMTAAAIGFGLSLLTTYVALWTALRHRVKVWLGPAAYRARGGRFWPPHHGETNFAEFVTVTALLFSMFASLIIPVVLLAKGGAPPKLAFAVIVGSTTPACLLFVFAFQMLDHRLFARSPQECWPAADGESAYEAADGEPVY